MGRKKNRKRWRYQKDHAKKQEAKGGVKEWKQIKKYMPCHSGTMKVFEDPKSGVSVFGGGYMRDLAIYVSHMVIDVGADVEVEGIQIKNASYPELEKFNNPIVKIDWEDFGVVSLPIAFWKTLVKLIRKEKRSVTVCCQGGHGRTGTVLAILAGLMGADKINPVKFVREKYCYKAVETFNQLKYVAYITDTKRLEEMPNEAFTWEWEECDVPTEGKGAVYSFPHDTTTSDHTQREMFANEDVEEFIANKEDGKVNGFEKITTASGASIYTKTPLDEIIDKIGAEKGKGVLNDLKQYDEETGVPFKTTEDRDVTYTDGKLVETTNKNGVLVIEAGHQTSPLREDDVDGNYRSDNPLDNVRDIDKEELDSHYNSHHKKHKFDITKA